MKRHWWLASPSQLYARAMALEAELSVAARLLELREQRSESAGSPRSQCVTELQQKWRELIKTEPEVEPEVSTYRPRELQEI